MSLIGYWRFADAPQQNVVADLAGNMDITHGGGSGAGWWRDSPDYAIFGRTNQWRFLVDTPNRPDPTPHTNLSFCFAIKALAGNEASQMFILYGVSTNGYKGWAFALNYSSGSISCLNSAAIWDGNSWQTFPNPNNVFPSVADQVARYHGVAVNITNGGVCEAFIGGQSLGTVTINALQHDTTGDPAAAWGVNYSYTDNIQYHDRALTADEIQQHSVIPRSWQEYLDRVGYNFRQDIDHITDSTGFTAVTDDGPDGYGLNGGYGWTQSPDGYRDRGGPAGVDQLNGIAFSTGNGDQFRFDLPSGTGTYRVYATHGDASASFSTGFRYKDGDTGTEFATITGADTKFNYIDITGVSNSTTAFDLATENYIEHTFVNDYFTITRDTSINGAVQGKICSVWVERVFKGLGDEKAWYCPSLDDSPDDLSGNDVHGTYQGGTATVSDTNLGGVKAYEFNGSTTYINIYDSGINGSGGAMDFLASADWSASFYAKCDNASGNARDPFFGSRTRSGYTGWYASNNDNFSDYTITTGVGSVASFYKWTNDPQLDTDWHHVCFVNNGGTVSLYVDNVLSGTTNSIPDLSEMTSFFLGRASNYFYFNGRMDDIRFYDRAITANEVAHLATSRGIEGGPTPPPPPSGFYNPFNNKTFNPNYTRRIG